jgi:hypothetical protein
MIFGAVPTAVPGVLQTVARNAAIDTVNNPQATDTQKQAATQILQSLGPEAAPTPDFFTQNRTALLLGGGAAVLAGVGYWYYHTHYARRRR